MFGRLVAGVALVSLVAGCQATMPASENMALLAEATEGSQAASSTNCVSYLSAWSGLPESSLEALAPPGPPHGPSASQFFSGGGEMWVCVADKTNPANLTGLSMGPLAVEDFEDYYAHYTFEKYYAGMSPCDTAFDWADLYVALDAPEESISQRLLNSTFACRSVDEWWTSLQNYPEVFGVVSLPDEDMWSYLAAVCPSGTPSRVCEEAVADGLLQP